MPEKSKQPGQLLVSIAVEHRVKYGKVKDLNQYDKPVEKPRSFNDAAAAMTAGAGAVDAMHCMTMDAASAPCSAAHST